eukprot:CAMPEP_0172836210 /NCGR_PEP_ID=MMETSP1075-20121228/26334_1 /TAXON_ID=2916 /ORGANISM="Ceratium fusus, Strain PA161109" /LENGTH=71 /DNA_ID=CAMNT_0013679405 /DNA_START=59 /DNA_END=270 /DNA_ORIENTATION=+
MTGGRMPGKVALLRLPATGRSGGGGGGGKEGMRDVGGIVGISASVTTGGLMDVVAFADVAVGCPPGGTGIG